MKNTALRHGARVGTAVAILTATGGVAATASAADTVSPPSVSSDFVWYANTPYLFTFTEPAGETAASFEYSVNGASPVTVPAVNDSAQVNLTFSRSQDTLDVYAVAPDGTVSAATSQTFTPDDNVWAADKDLNGDGLPDLLTTGGAGTGLASGLWQAVGTGGGRVTHPAVNLIDAASGVPANWFDGAQAVPGHYGQSGFESILVYRPGAGSALMFPGSGDGSALDWPADVTTVSSSWLDDPITGDAPLQLTSGYDATGVGNRMDGLFSVAGDATHGYALDYLEAEYVGFSPIQLSGVDSPDGTADWNEWRIAGATDQSGVALYLWNQSTGALYLWDGVKVTDNGDNTGTIAYTQYVIACHWNKGTGLTTLEAADFDGSGTAGLWAVSTTGEVKAYRISGLSTSHPAVIKQVAAARLG